MTDSLISYVFEAERVCSDAEDGYRNVALLRLIEIVSGEV